MEENKFYFFYCPCGKLHTTSFVFWATVCPNCGRNLNSVMHLIEGHR